MVAEGALNCTKQRTNLGRTTHYLARLETKQNEYAWRLFKIVNKNILNISGLDGDQEFQI